MTLRKLRTRLLRLAFLPIVFVAIFVRPAWGLESTTAYVVELSGYLFLLAGLAVRIWCIFYIGGRKSRELIDVGPYSVCRNPLYIGTFLLVIGVALCFENLLMLLLVVIIIVPVHYMVALAEEKHLEKVFGDTYRAYKQQVPRFLPRFSNYATPETVTVPVRAIGRIAADTLMVLLVPQIEDLLELLYIHHVLPVLWHLPG